MIGKLNRRVTIQQESKASDGQGGETVTWTTFAADVWTSIEPKSAGQVQHSEQLKHRVTHTIGMRYTAGVTSAMRVLWGSRVFHIRGIKNPEEANRFLELSAEEGVPS